MIPAKTPSDFKATANLDNIVNP